MAKKWKTEKAGNGDEILNLYFAHHYYEPKVVATLWRDSDGEWLYTCALTNDMFEPLYDGNLCEHDAKLSVEETVLNHYEGERDYYQEILDAFEENESY